MEKEITYKKNASIPNEISCEKEKEIALKIIEENFKGMTYYNALSVTHRIKIALEERRDKTIL